MKFRTAITSVPADIALAAYRPVLSAGSCFAENMAVRMRECLWPASFPFGMLYNPASIAMVLRLMLLTDPATAMRQFEDTVFEAGGRWRSWMFDSRLIADSRQGLADAFARLRLDVSRTMTLCDTILVTFGTAWCYTLASNDMTVANCHKHPAALYRRYRLDPDEITDLWIPLIRDLSDRYPGLRFIFTVSPVRHLKDGFHENTLSKATLHLAVDRICSQTENTRYFPAFELVTDDLRDYRFYAADMAHPSEMAVEYVWQHFCDTYMSPETRQAIARGEKIQKRLSHRPMSGAPDPEFTAETERLLDEFRRDFPQLVISQ